jgi:hypothetical protein
LGAAWPTKALLALRDRTVCMVLAVVGG